MTNTGIIGTDQWAATYADISWQLGFTPAVHTEAEDAANTAFDFAISTVARGPFSALLPASSASGEPRAVLLVPPLAGTVKEADKLLNYAKRRHLPLSCLRPVRFHPGLARIKEIVSSEVMGQVTEVTICRRADYFSDFACRQDQGSAWLFYHDLDFCHWLLGPAASLEFTAAPERAEGQGTVVAVFAGGAKVKIITDNQDGNLDITVIGSRGSVAYHAGETTCRCTGGYVERQYALTGSHSLASLQIPLADPMVLEISYLARKLQAGSVFDSSPARECREVVAMMTALEDG